MGQPNNDLDDDERATLNQAAAWARQSIAFAFSIRSDDAHGGMDAKKAGRAFTEAGHLSNDLWEAAKKDCGHGASLDEVIAKYSRDVFDWCYRHMNR
jgi:hypothetical protein